MANADDVADWEGAQRLVNAAIDAFGDLHVLVNNAGILRDRVLVNMSEGEWDDVVRVHLRGHFAPTRWAAAYWREEAKSGRAKPRNLVHTSSTSGLFANPGQSNYGAAKSAIATFSQIVAKELARYEVRSNCIAPAARTRLTLATPGLEDIMTVPEGGFDVWDPANVSPLVAYLSTAGCPFTGETFFVQGGVVKRVQSWTMAETVEQSEMWTVEALGEALSALAGMLSDERRGRSLLTRCDHSVIALISSAICLETSSLGIDACNVISFIMSPCTVILPDMNACIPAA